jgi:putative two-component system response regulator
MGLSVLIVDDDFINRTLLKSILRKYKGEITEMVEAENGSDALDKLKVNDNIDIVLLDIIMPILNGIEFLKIFRADSSFNHIPVVVLSTDDTRKGEVLDLGANDFLRKPIKGDELFTKIMQWTA